MPGSVLDSFALIAYFQDEAGADKVEALLHKAAHEHEPLHMTEVNYAEVQYIIIRRNGLTGWETVADRLVALPIRFNPVTRELADTAARFKASHPISLADAFAAALAKIRNTELVTGDRDFDGGNVSATRFLCTNRSTHCDAAHCMQVMNEDVGARKEEEDEILLRR
jgi:predicted nucleic acid-binding protein